MGVPEFSLSAPPPAEVRELCECVGDKGDVGELGRDSDALSWSINKQKKRVGDGSKLEQLTKHIPPAKTFVRLPPFVRVGPFGFLGVGVPRSAFAAAAATREEAGIGLGEAIVNVNESGDICDDGW